MKAAGRIRRAVGLAWQVLTRRKDFSLEDYLGKVNVNLGCGKRPMAGFRNVDISPLSAAEVIADLNQPLPFESESVDLIYADNVFEHLEDIPAVILECRRVLRPGGHLVAAVPYFRSPYAFVDPTHRHFFTLASFNYFVPGTLAHERYPLTSETFASLEVHLCRCGQEKKRLARLLRNFGEMFPHRFEHSLLGRLVRFDNVIFVLRR